MLVQTNKTNRLLRRMPKFAVKIHGVNFLIQDAGADRPSLMGFYVNAHLESATAYDAEMQAIELVRSLPKLRPAIVNTRENPPRMFV